MIAIAGARKPRKIGRQTFVLKMMSEDVIDQWIVFFDLKMCLLLLSADVRATDLKMHKHQLVAVFGKFFMFMTL